MIRLVQLAIAVDIEDVVSRAVGIHGTPVPADLGASLPYAMVTRTGGGRNGLVVDNHYVDIDVWSESDDWAGATEYAARLEAAILESKGCEYAGAVICAASVESHPYNNPDPDHPTLARVTFSMLITTRAIIEETQHE